MLHKLLLCTGKDNALGAKPSTTKEPPPPPPKQWGLLYQILN